MSDSKDNANNVNNADKPEPKKRGRPKGAKSVKLSEGSVPNYINLGDLTEEQKLSLLSQLNKNLNIKPERGNDKQARFRGNKFVDDLKLCKEDRAFTKKVEFTVSDRGERRIGSEVKCEKCNQMFIHTNKKILSCFSS